MGGMVAAGTRTASTPPSRCAVGQWNQKLDTVFTLKTLLLGDTAVGE